MSPQKQNKTILWIAAALVIAVAVFALCYLFFAPQAADGAKTITIAVTDDQDATIVYETTTNAQYLRQAMEDTKDLTFQGTEGQYGLMLDTINGLTATGKKTKPGGASMSTMRWPITELTVSQSPMAMSSSSSTAHKTMQNNVRQLARLGLMVAVLEVSKLALAAIPNIELVSFWVILFTLWIGWRSLYAIYGFVLLEGILYGVHFWWIAYLYVWTILAALSQLLRKQTGAALLGHIIRLVWIYFQARCVQSLMQRRVY